MFCFKRNIESTGRQLEEGKGPASKGPVLKGPVPSEDAISDLSSDGKYEIELPPPSNKFALDTIRFIDSEEKHDEEEVESTSSTEDDKSNDKINCDVFITKDDSLPVFDSPVRLDEGKLKAGIEYPGRLSSTSSTAEISSRRSSVGSITSSRDIDYTIEDVSPMRSRSPAPGPRFKLLLEGDIHVCLLNHTHTIISKILSSKFLRRWETHHLQLADEGIISSPASGAISSTLTYSSMMEVYSVARWDANHKYCFRIVIPDGSLLLQAKNAYIRDQWVHSIQWKRHLHKFRSILTFSHKRDVVLSELKNMIDYVMSSPIQDESVTLEAFDLITKVLIDEKRWSEDSPAKEAALKSCGPLLSTSTLPSTLCEVLGQYCRTNPKSPRMKDTLACIARRILKHNVDFGKSPHLRRYIQDYISALNNQHNGREIVKAWVAAVHGPNSVCPHPRILPNLAASCLAALHTPQLNNTNLKLISTTELDLLHVADEIRATDPQSLPSSASSLSNLSEDGLSDLNDDEESAVPLNPVIPTNVTSEDKPYYTSVAESRDLVCFANVIKYMSEYLDWSEGLGALLQPVPVPASALQHPEAGDALATAAMTLGRDPRCSVHRRVLPLREGRQGWFHLLCPTNNESLDTQVQLWGDMLEVLLSCCCKRKHFLSELAQMLPACLLLALRAHPAGFQSLCLMLEWEVMEDEQTKVEAVQALRSTSKGRRALKVSCQRQVHLKKIQQKGGPRRLTLPSRATDTDVVRLLSAGSFGNLECLSLAFTNVTSAVAEQLIKLPSLRYLNLWATQFGDAGVLLIAEHLQRLQVLNLCETPVTDVGIGALANLQCLKKLNLNSTKLSAAAWTELKSRLPALQESDVRYTDAW